MLPFDDRDGHIWFNGALVPWREARVHVLTHGLHYGSCVFEGERAYGAQIFRISRDCAGDRRWNMGIFWRIPRKRWVLSEISILPCL